VIRWLAALTVVVAVAVAYTGTHKTSHTVRYVKVTPAETVYIRNLAPRYISDAEIRNDLPAWQTAINHDFARYWHTAQFRLVFVGRKAPPYGQINATFVGKGPVKGALAYHNTDNGAPSITVYAGTGDYYGYDNSVSFTHELEELAGDPVVSAVNSGWPYDYIWLEKPDTSLRQSFQFGVLGWFNEVSDPVEADSYLRPGANGKPVKVSDFVTPAWFNDTSGTRYDYMGLCQQPFWIRPGGYAQFLDGNGWEILTNFRQGHPSDRGFLRGEHTRS
jgi:hypothetical protein